jgi:hypothetical protein
VLEERSAARRATHRVGAHATLKLRAGCVQALAHPRDCRLPFPPEVALFSRTACMTAAARGDRARRRQGRGFWRGCLRDLVERGLVGVQLAVSDATQSLR